MKCAFVTLTICNSEVLDIWWNELQKIKKTGDEKPDKIVHVNP